MPKVPFTDIKAITFRAGKLTKSRRTSAIPQLTCVGKACDSYTPDIVQCTNMGPDDLGEIQWRCDADLPPGFRLGKVEVSCEGWSKPGDKFVLQVYCGIVGSCGLEYNLYQSDPRLYDTSPKMRTSTGMEDAERLLDKAFNLLFWLVTLILLYTLLRAFLRRFFPSYAPPSLHSFFPPGDGPGDGHHHHHHGWGGGGGGPPGPGFNPGPPPPYTKQPPGTATGPGAAATGAAGGGNGIGGGLWTGLALGGLAGWLAGRNTGPTTQNINNGPQAPQVRVRRRGAGGGLWAEEENLLRRQRRFDDEDDSGPSRAGPSQPVGLRRSTGFGGSSVR